MHLEHNPEREEAMRILTEGEESLLLTGRAGTGKSTLLNEFRLHTKKKVVVLAPTGIAAINVQGETIHAFCGFKPNVTLFSALKRASHLKKEERAMYKKVEMIVIDEISMVRADLMDIFDRFLRKAVGDERPFGGKQMVWIGDLYQLPPVLKNEEKEDFHLLYKTPYFFSSQVIKELLWSTKPPLHVELKTIYRQEEKEFVEVLNKIREGTMTSADFTLLAGRVGTPENSETCIHLTATNLQADKENERRLHALDTDPQIFYAKTTGSLDGYTFPAKDALELKKGARVMCLNNDSGGRWQNGSLATVVDLGEEVTILMDSGQTHTLEPFRWELYHTILDEEKGTLEQKVQGSFTQYPLKLAWAITIHKSQGQTFDQVFVDLGRGAFAEGQTYVALSRCRTLGGLFLKNPLRPRDIKVDGRIASFFTAFTQKKKGVVGTIV